MARYLPVHNSSQPAQTSAGAIAAAGGWHVVVNGGFAGELDGTKALRARGLVRAARGLAARWGTQPRILQRWRPDVWAPHRAVTMAAGFEPRWVLRGVPSDHGAEVLRAWGASDWTLGLAPTWPDGEWARLVGEGYLGGDSWPQAYYRGDAATQRAEVHGLVTDLRDPEMRAWAVDRAAHALWLTGADALLIGAKAGWHMAGSPERHEPGRDPQVGGVLYDSPYAPGEWEEAFAALLRELLAEEVGVVLHHAPARPQDLAMGDVWAYLPADVRDRLVGEHFGAPSPGA